MTHTLLVPLDGTPQGEQALPQACRLAREIGAVLVLAQSYSRDTGELPSTIEAKAGAAKAYLEAHRRRLGDTGLSVDIQVLDADPAPAIIGTAQRRNVDLIVMSTHGRSGLHCLFVGSVAKEVLRQTAVPVLLVRVSKAQPASSEGAKRTVLVPLDGTPFAETTLTYLLDMGCRPRDIMLLYAMSSSAHPKPQGVREIVAPGQTEELRGGPDRERSTAQCYLERMNRQYLTGRAVVLDRPIGDAGPTIVDTAAEEEVEFIAMATHDLKGLDRHGHGGAAHYVVHHATVPVLLKPDRGSQPGHAEHSTRHLADNLARLLHV